MSLSKTRAEQSKGLTGAWVSADVHGFEGVKLKVRGWANPDFVVLRTKLVGEVPRDRRKNGELGPEDAQRIQTECLLQTVLLDWRGPGMQETDESEEIPYTPEKAREFLTDPLLEPLRQAVVAASMNVTKEGRETLEEEAKN